MRSECSYLFSLEELGIMAVLAFGQLHPFFSKPQLVSEATETTRKKMKNRSLCIDYFLFIMRYYKSSLDLGRNADFHTKLVKKRLDSVISFTG